MCSLNGFGSGFLLNKEPAEMNAASLYKRLAQLAQDANTLEPMRSNRLR